MVAIDMRHELILAQIKAFKYAKQKKQKRREYVKKRLEQLLSSSEPYKWDFPGQNG